MKKLTNKQQQMVERYYNALNRYGVRDVRDCYKTPSVYKTRAEYFIKNEMNDLNKNPELHCDDYTVTSYNTSKFSCGYVVYNLSQIGFVGERRALVIHTHCNRYIIPFDDYIEEEIHNTLGEFRK